VKIRTFALAILLCLPAALSDAQSGDGILRVGDRPPALDFKSYGSDKVIDWASLSGRVVVIEFWATWCPPCIKNIPHINALAREFRDECDVVISVTYESEGIVEKFLRNHPLQTVIGLDNDFAMFKSYRAWGIPMTVIVNRKGTIACVIHPDRLSDSLIREVLNGNVPRVKPAQAWSDPQGAEQYFRSLLKKGQSEK
jgi:thiol-disulfide isomerase/thioredoxin